MTTDELKPDFFCVGHSSIYTMCTLNENISSHWPLELNPHLYDALRTSMKLKSLVVDEYPPQPVNDTNLSDNLKKKKKDTFFMPRNWATLHMIA